MEISKNWTPEERKSVALNLTIQARNKAARFPTPKDSRRFIWECLEVIAILLGGTGAAWLEANRVQILEHYKE